MTSLEKSLQVTTEAREMGNNRRHNATAAVVRCELNNYPFKKDRSSLRLLLWKHRWMLQ